MAKVNRKELLTQLKKANKFVPRNNTIEVATGILVEIENGTLTLSATDIGIASLIAKIPCETTIGEKEEFVLKAKLFVEIVSKLNTDVISFEVKKNSNGSDTVCIKGDKSKFNITSLGDKETFPSVDSNIREMQSITISSELIKELVNKTVRFTSDDEARAILGGVNVLFSKDTMVAAALDGYRLAYYTAEIENEKQVEFIIAGPILASIANSIEKEDVVTINYNDDTSIVEFNFGDTSIFANQLEGNFFDYKQIIKPDDTKTTFVVDSKKLKEAVQRANIIVEAGSNNYILLEAEEDNLIIRTNSELGKVVEKVKIESIEGETIDYKIAFNPKYILDGINVIDSENVEIKTTSSLKEAYLIDRDNNFLYFMLPIRVAANNYDEEVEKAS